MRVCKVAAILRSNDTSLIAALDNALWTGISLTAMDLAKTYLEWGELPNLQNYRYARITSCRYLLCKGFLLTCQTVCHQCKVFWFVLLGHCIAFPALRLVRDFAR